MVDSGFKPGIRLDFGPKPTRELFAKKIVAILALPSGQPLLDESLFWQCADTTARNRCHQYQTLQPMCIIKAQ